MLSLLHIENIAIIESADIRFDSGLNVLTGETGAGKSIVIDAISAVLGQRTSRELIRTGAKSALVTAVFTGLPPLAWLADNGVDQGEELLLQREIQGDGRNACRLNGRPITVAQMRELGRCLLDIHGQHDGQQLLDPACHLAYLDRFGRTLPLLEDYQADLAMTGVKSDWGNVSVQELPTFAEDSTVKEPTDQQSQSAMEQGSQIDSVHTEDDSPYSSTEEETFFQLFYEIDYNSMQDYLNDHPDALSDGWGAININEAGLDESGTSIQTIHGDQVLALDASNGVLLVRINLGSSRGIMAICKDTSRLSLRAASTLPATGQTAGNICDANNGILAITGSAFLDDGTSNGGQISGLAVCNGVQMGSRLGGYGDKRLELRNDNRMYIVDSASAVDSDTRDACEFRPALIVDGENVAGNSTWNSPNPRAVLGQSAKLETMMVVVEGRLLDSPGCGVEDIADKLEEYGCVQALNLDGGTSAIMYYKGEYVTRCSNTALPGGRTLPSAWVYERAS